MGHRPVLDLPTRLPRWATDAGATVEPGESDKDTGWVVGTRPPARWMNYLQNLVYEWVQKMSGSIISEVIDGPTTGSTDQYCAIGYPADPNSTVVIESDRSITTVIEGGESFSTDGTLTNYPFPRCITTDSDGRVILATNVASAGTSGLYISHQTDVSGIWNDVATAYNTKPASICSEGSLGTAIMVGSDVGVMYYTAIATTALAIVTVPTYVAGAGTDREIVGIVRIATDTWLIVTKTGEVFYTANNGSTWTARTTVTATEDIADVSHNDVTGRIIAVGEDNFFYSDDGGVSWTAATVNADTTDYGGGCVQYVGSTLWVSGWRDGDSGKLYGSYDDGETWYYIVNSAGTKYAVYDIGCMSNAVIFAADTARIYITHAILGGA